MEERVPIRPLIEFLKKKQVPNHKHTYWHLFGGMTLFFFTVQVLTGLLLTLYYKPTPETAHESVKSIMEDVSFGWFIRSLHHWTSHLMVISLLVHFGSKLFLRAYQKPRELTWASGVVLLLIVFTFAFTGYLLPWDTMAYFATQIGTDVPQAIPVIGPLMVSLLRAGEYVDGTTLTRVFSLHAIILPLVCIGLVAFHLVLNQHTGSADPEWVKRRGPPIRFLPSFVYRDLLSWIACTAILLGACLILPATLGPKADTLASAPHGIKPEWYFLPLFQTLRMAPGTIFGLESQVVINAGVVATAILLIFVPLINPSKGRLTFRHYLVKVVGILGIVYYVGTIILAYATTEKFDEPQIAGSIPEAGVRISALVIILFFLMVGAGIIYFKIREENEAGG